MYIYIYAISIVNLFITQTNSYQILSSYDIITYDVVYCSCHDDTELLKDIDIYIYTYKYSRLIDRILIYRFKYWINTNINATLHTHTLTTLHLCARVTTKVVSWYVKCPLHHSHRSCLKSMQENQGGKDVVIRKLLYWVAHGHSIDFSICFFNFILLIFTKCSAVQ